MVNAWYAFTEDGKRIALEGVGGLEGRIEWEDYEEGLSGMIMREDRVGEL